MAPLSGCTLSEPSENQKCLFPLRVIVPTSLGQRSRPTGWRARFPAQGKEGHFSWRASPGPVV